MSKYSGKCDFCDTIDMYGEDWILNKSKIYIHTNRKNKVIKFDKPSDLIPFYPHIISSMASSKKTGSTIWLSQYPYPYEENKEYWDMTVKRFKHKLAYQRQKARKTGDSFNLADFTAQFIRDWTFFRENDDQLWDVCNQIVEKKSTIKYPLRNGVKWFMTELTTEMARAGIDPTTFGYIVKDGEVEDYDPNALQRHIKTLEE